MEPATTNYIIYTSVGVGCVMVVIAMALNIISGLKQKKYAKAIFGPNGVAGLVFYGSLLVGLVLQMFAGIPVMNAAYIICLIILPCSAFGSTRFWESWWPEIRTGSRKNGEITLSRAFLRPLKPF